MPLADPSATGDGTGSDQTGTDEDGTDRLLTVPNGISVGRLLCLPIFLYLLFGRENRAAAASLLGFLGASDWVDGYIARRFHQVSDLGKILDPVADRLLFFVAIAGILIDGTVPVWFAWLILVREAVVGGTTVILAAMGARRVAVTWWGKAGTFFNMWAFPMFLASESTIGWADTARTIAWSTALPGLVLSYVAWALYLPLATRALREGRTDRVPAA